MSATGRTDRREKGWGVCLKVPRADSHMMTPERPLRILLVCTGNTCRSPMAAALLSDRAEREGMDLVVKSAGTSATGGGAMPDAISVMANRGIDLRDHRSRSLANALDGDFDILLGLSPSHSRAIKESAEPEWTFALKEFVATARAAGPRLPGEDVGDYVSRLHYLRTQDPPQGEMAVDDPIGKGLAAYERCAVELSALIDEVIAALQPARDLGG